MGALSNAFVQRLGDWKTTYPQFTFSVLERIVRLNNGKAWWCHVRVTQGPCGDGGTDSGDHSSRTAASSTARDGRGSAIRAVRSATDSCTTALSATTCPTASISATTNAANASAAR